ncbi:MAG: putative long-chain-fatty-acid--CoA ligase [Actinomycetia bacterium]|nr:putative long-chain-fatty-acid--CoA ligase [Actinomycetes bacterium]
MTPVELSDPVARVNAPLGIGDVLAQNTRSYGAATAVVCREHRATYEDLAARVARLTSVFRAAGVDAGARVLWLGQNCHRFLEALLAAGQLGAMVCPANWRSSAAELGFVLEDLDPVVVLWQEEEIGALVAEVRANASPEHAGRTWIRHDGDGADDYEARVAAASPVAGVSAVDPERPLAVLYTAAFDGRPNGSLLTHTNLLTQGLMVAMMQAIDRDTVYLNCGPLFHIATLFVTIPTFQFGGTNVFVRRMEAEELCRVIAAERCTRAFILPPTINEIVSVNADGRHDLSSMQSGFDIEGWNDMVAPDTAIWGTRPAGYGQTEVLGLVTFAGLGGTPGDFTTGRASPLTSVRIVDDEDREVAVGAVGEIVARGVTVGAGYWNRPELNERRRRNGWWHTNDLGRRNADGTVTFVGPKLRMIKSAAENIYPVEVEACLESHAGVREAAVIGVPDERWGQSVKAIVAVQPGANPTEDELIAHCRINIGSYKKPRTIEFVDALPRRGGPKDYDALDARFGGGGYPGSV